MTRTRYSVLIDLKGPVGHRYKSVATALDLADAVNCFDLDGMPLSWSIVAAVNSHAVSDPIWISTILIHAVEPAKKVLKYHGYEVLNPRIVHVEEHEAIANIEKWLNAYCTEVFGKVDPQYLQTMDS